MQIPAAQTGVPMVPRVPKAGLPVTAKVRAPPSTSLAERVIVVAVSSLVETLWPLATGASLTAVTVMVTVAAGEVSVPSLTAKVKLSEPLKLAFGV